MKNLFIGGTSSIISRTATSPLEIFRLQRQNPFMPHSTINDIFKLEGLNQELDQDKILSRLIEFKASFLTFSKL